MMRYCLYRVALLFFVAAACVLQAYDLDPLSNRDGAAIIADLMVAAENHRDKLTIILAGYKDDIERRCARCMYIAYVTAATAG